MNKVLLADINSFADSFCLRNQVANSTFLITGATGLIGSTLIYCLLTLGEGIRIIAPVRNIGKAARLLGDYASQIELIECDIINFDYNSLGAVDYIIHCAAPTSSKFFVESPVETFDTIIYGTKVLLEYARCHPVKGLVFLSSLEVYGTIENDSKPISEDYQGYIDPMDVRSSYPMAKRAAENLCCSYSKEYDVPVKVARLTQTTGAGIANDDNRIIAQFARLISNSQDIVLHTKGESARPYCYTTDCVSAILYILLRGKEGEAYNVANEETYISARGMAEFLKDNFTPAISVRVEINDNMGYAPTTRQKLSTKKLQSLGWAPQYGLKEIFNNLICYLSNA